MQQVTEEDVPDSLEMWSRMVRDRAGNKCARCGETRALVAHHIEPKSVRPELALVLENGECLCSNCHWEHHRLHPVGPRGPRTGTESPRFVNLAEATASRDEARADRLQRRLLLASNEIAALREALAVEGAQVRKAQRSAMDCLRARGDELTRENTRLRQSVKQLQSQIEFMRETVS